uniref:1-phosphatidylinositol-4,5-bisphosphate phosphodiesterase beta-2 n=1 Tax=Heterorhabditis bacteriophora TaxID=37862 RepID=A0A1I7WNS1_HETBA
MSFDYSHGDKPVIKVVRHEGDDIQTPFEDSSLGKLLGNFNQHFSLKAPSIYSDDSDELFGFRNSNVGFGQFEMDKVRQRLNQLMELFSQQFFDGIRKHAKTAA